MKIKRIGALLLAALMLCTMLTGCADSNDATLQGKWEKKIDLASWILPALENSAEFGPLMEYVDLPDLTVGIAMKFEKRGSAEAILELGALKNLVELLEQLAPSALEVVLTEAGYPELVPIMELLLTQMTSDEYSDSISLKCNYKAQDGKMKLSFKGLFALLGSVELDYSISGNTLTFTSATVEKEELNYLLALLLPLELYKA